MAYGYINSIKIFFCLFSLIYLVISLQLESWFSWIKSCRPILLTTSYWVQKCLEKLLIMCFPFWHWITWFIILIKFWITYIFLQMTRIKLSKWSSKANTGYSKWFLDQEYLRIKTIRQWWCVWYQSRRCTFGNLKMNHF